MQEGDLYVQSYLGLGKCQLSQRMEERSSPGEPQHGNDDSTETNKNDRHKLVEQNCFKWASSSLDAKQNKRTFCVFVLLAYKLEKSKFSGHSSWEHL